MTRIPKKTAPMDKSQISGLTCPGCGERQHVKNAGGSNPDSPTIEQLEADGWKMVGGAYRCPRCADKE